MIPGFRSRLNIGIDNMLICISGTPGTGKSSVGRAIALLAGIQIIEANDFVRSHGLITGRDKLRKSLIVDTKGLKRESLALKGDRILVGHISHFAKCGICIILRTNPDVLEARLKKRRWSKEKIAENVEAEILDACLKEAADECGIDNVFEIDTTGKRPKVAAAEALTIIRGTGRKSHKPGKINWIKYLKIS